MLAIDADTSPNNLKYLIWKPIDGRLVMLKNNKNEKFFESIQTFTQSDLDKESVFFVPNKSILFNK